MLALLGVVVLVVAIVALHGPGGHSVKAGSRLPGSPGNSAAPRSSVPASGGATSRPSTSAASSGTAAARLPIVVLNNTTVTGLAEQASHTFEQGGWTVTKYDNYQNDILSTCAYYDPSVTGAKAAAQALRRQFPAIKRVEPQFAELASWNSPIVVILTPDYTTG